jgi:alpha-tubulin suppressor-like RCC1 family protein
LAANSGGSVLVNVSLTINDTAPASVSYASASNALSVTAAAGGTFSPAAGSGGTVTSYAFNAAGSAASITYGLTLNASTGVITVPTSATTAVSGASFGVIAANSGGSQTITLSLSISAAAVSIGNSTVVASPSSITADGATTTTITVTLKDSYGNTAPAGKSVSLTSSRGATDTITTSPSSTNASGQVTFTAKSSTAGNSTYTAIDVSDNTGSSSASNAVTFNAGTASALAISGGNNQSITAGATLSSLSVTVTDAKGNLVGNQLVTWAITSGSGTLPASSSTTNNTTGIATLSGTPFTLTTAQASTQTITATIGGTSTSQIFTTTVTASSPSLSYSTLTTSTPALPPDNTTTATISATIKDSYNNPVSGNTVTFSQVTEAGSIVPTLSATTATTSALGVASITIKAASSGFATLSAATSGTVITLPSLNMAWTGAPSITTQSIYYFITSNAPGISVSNTGGAITSCSISPSLPSSLSLNTSTCKITPVAAAVGVPLRSTYTITATNSYGTSTANITIAAFFYSDRQSDNMCGWNGSGDFMCWGSNGNGELGDGTNTSRLSAAITTPVATQGANVMVQATGDAWGSSCALTSAGAVYCSGGNQFYDLGNGGTSNSSAFAQPTGLSSGVTQLANLYVGYCALKSGGTVMCWGTQPAANTGFGPSTSASYTTPTTVSSLTGLANISGSDNNACAITTAGAINCWGKIWADNDTNQTTTSWSTVGSSVATLTGFSNPIQMSTAAAFTLFLNSAGRVAGFGDNVFYQLASTGGDQVSTSLTTISSSTLSSVIQVATSGAGWSTYPASACAVFAGGSISCWGANNLGQLGQGTTGSSVSTPTSVSSITNAVAVFGIGQCQYNSNGFCALLSTGAYVCWGEMFNSTFNTPTITTISGLP